ncbi:dr1-associated corepressor-like [Halichondria panicea]|uniref:dr1-associated corepressor-like n=1 Tax=Halichondria panicea TaxID=6063 RepID=UPI00312B42DD
MPPKRKKFESTFPAARIKKIMQLDDDVGRVASSVPVVISRAVEIFLESLLTRAADYADSRKAKTLTVSHMKHCIESERQWDFLKELTSKIADISAEQEEAAEKYVPKRGRKRRTSPSGGKARTGKRKQKQSVKKEESSESEDESPQPEREPPQPAAATTIKESQPVQLSESQSAEVSVPSLVTPVSVGGSLVTPVGVGGSLSSLTAGLQRVTSQENNSDDDYD